MSTPIPPRRFPRSRRDEDHYFRQREREYLERGYTPEGADTEAEADLSFLRQLRPSKPYRRGWMRPKKKTSTTMQF